MSGLRLHPVYEFGDFQLDAMQRTLRAKDGRSVPLTARVFDTLHYLVEHAGQMVEKPALLKAIWPHAVVEEGSLAQAIHELRRALGEQRDAHRFIVTVPGRGYQFVADVQLRAQPSLPMVDPQPAAPAVTWLNWIRRGSIPRIHARHLVGAIMLSGAAVAAWYGIAMREREGVRVDDPPGATAHAARSVEANREYLAGRQLMAHWTPEEISTAMGHFRNAINLDPDYAAAYAQLAEAMLLHATPSAHETIAAREAAAPLIAKALALDPGLGEAYAVRSRLHPDGAYAEIEADLRRGLALDPSYANGYEQLADVLVWEERFDEAFAAIDQARALDPLWPRYHHFKAIIHFDLGQWDEAEALERETLRLDPRYFRALVRLGWISQMRGEYAQSIDYLEQALAVDVDNESVRAALGAAYLYVDDVTAARSLDTEREVDLDMDIALFDRDYPRAAGLFRKAHPASLRGDREPDWQDLDIALQLALATGDLAPARLLLQAAEGDGDGAAQAPSRWTLPVRLNAALLRYVADGRNQEVAPLIRQLQQQVPGIEHADPDDMLSVATMSKAVAAAVLGDRDLALATLEKLHGSGTNPRWWRSRGHPAFDTLRAEPRFQALVDVNEAHLAQQRDLLEQLRHDGRVPRRSEAISEIARLRD